MRVTPMCVFTSGPSRNRDPQTQGRVRNPHPVAARFQAVSYVQVGYPTTLNVTLPGQRKTWPAGSMIRPQAHVGGPQACLGDSRGRADRDAGIDGNSP